jgi:DNA repair protein RadD
MELRSYQKDAVDAVHDYLRRQNGNPCVVLPTGSGKMLLLATICSDVVTRWQGRGLVLAHVKELLQQAADKLQLICPKVHVGVYSAGLRSRETDAAVIVAGIQSVYKKSCKLDRFDLIIVDECHLLPPDGEGMYQTFLKDAKIVNPHVRLIGLTATPYRMKSGNLVGPDNLLNHICYEIGVKELIEQVFLCPLRSKSGRHKVDCNDLHIRAGEFVQSEIDQLINTSDNVDATVREIVSQTKERNSVLIFGVSVDHATRIKENIERFTSHDCGLVVGDTPSSDRERILRRFKGESFQKDLLGSQTGPLKFLVNVNVLTTGFDAPNVDCVVLLRPTASPGLYYQMVGRSFRLHESKQDCLVLDYGGNILRHGPVDAIQIVEKQEKGGGTAPAKECPECLALIHVCPDCGY